MMITMRAYKYNGNIHYESPMKLLEKRSNLYILNGLPGRTLKHHTRGKDFVFERHSIEFYFNDRWYTAACVINVDGSIDYYYCNISMPCKLGIKDVSFVDIDLDVIVQSDMSYKIVDRDEFNIHKEEMSYPDYIVKKAEKAVETVILHLEEREFPFDGYIEKIVAKYVYP